MFNFKNAVKGTVFGVIGTGGFQLQAGFQNNPEWIAKRDGSSYGHVRLHVANKTFCKLCFVTYTSNKAYIHF